MTFLEALKPYLHPTWGVVGLYPADGPLPNNANYHLWTAMSVKLSGDEALIQHHAAFIESSWALPGLLRRFPLYPGDTSWDESIGAAYGAYRASRPDIPKAILERGVMTDDNWDVESPGAWTWKGAWSRNLMFKPFLRACAGLPVGQLSQIKWSAGLLLSLFSKREETSGKNLCWLQIEPMMTVGPITQLATLLWSMFMKRSYPGGPKDFLEVFIPNHPIALYAPETFL